MRLKESRERSTDVGGGRLHGFELRGEFIAEQGDQSALKGGPAGETRGADFARPAPQIVERLLRSFFVGAVGGMHDHAAIGEEDRRARRGGNGDREAAGSAALQHRMVAAGEEALPRKRQTVGAKARKIGEMRPARTGGDPVGRRDFGDDERDLTHRRSSACSRKNPGPSESGPRVRL